MYVTFVIGVSVISRQSSMVCCNKDCFFFVFYILCLYFGGQALPGVVVVVIWFVLSEICVGIVVLGNCFC